MNPKLNSELEFKSKIIGHRGAKACIMENTLESILYAIDLGVDGIEFDVYKCFTGELVLYHDETLNRLVFKDSFYFENTINKEINKLQWYHLYNTELIDTMGRKYKIPKLIDILRHPKIYNSDVLINIELKDKVSHENLVDIITEVIDEGLYEPDRFLVSSFHDEPLIYLKEFKDEMYLKDEKYQNFKIGLIFSQETIHENNLLTEVKKHLKVISHVVLDKFLINQDVLDNIKQLGLNVFVYTINKKEEYPIKNLENIVDGIITDNPNFLIF